jgi:hypothetical protein
MDMLMAEFAATHRLDRNTLLVQSALCALPLAAIIIALAANLLR